MRRRAALITRVENGKTMDYDAIVVGGRCAGAPTAMLLARQGHRVLIVDRATFPSDTTSTHYIHQAGLLKLQDWGLLERLVAAGVPAIRKMNYRNEGMDLIGFAEPVADLDAVYNPRRDLLDTMLIDSAREAGVHTLTQFAVTDLLHDADGAVTGVSGTDRDGRRQKLSAKIVIGADGAHSTVARLAGAISYNVRPAASFSYWNYFHGLDWSEAHHKTGFNRRWFGSWPTNGDATMVAVILSNDQLKAFQANPEQSFYDVVSEMQPEMGEQLRDLGQKEGRFRRMRAADNFYRESSGPGWALVGDAGYHKDAITGWGMSDAFIHAEILAGCVGSALDGERPMTEAVNEFVAVRDEITAPMYDYTTTVAEMQLPPFFRSVIDACSRSQGWTNTMLGVVAGVVDGDEIFAPESLERLYEESGLATEMRVYDPGAA